MIKINSNSSCKLLLALSSLFWLTVLPHLKYKMYFLKLMIRNLMMILNLTEIQILLILNEKEKQQQQQQQQHDEKRVVLTLLTLEYIVLVHPTESLHHYSINIPKRIKTYSVNSPEIISVKFLMVIESFIIVMD